MKAFCEEVGWSEATATVRLKRLIVDNISNSLCRSLPTLVAVLHCWRRGGERGRRQGGSAPVRTTDVAGGRDILRVRYEDGGGD